ncbi:MAG: NADPH-dependent 7-cyano-7-deazaguanine reductase QueF [Candidatus Thermoplasmatota archaeon]|nr:NADPH-dependent 7-cyano-7-deazaguanine reductase QueF [Candidatus Thermoplasmatota archaeon]MBS3789440.1 NADPH-dependent 7-cyano-7-deazaguanine reductase QueF [Candidatus Thermoplasmatota archaeon]
MELETLENRYEDIDYKIKIISPEFTCLCPGKPEQPDFATISITYVPDKYLIELKSLKYYLVGYRDKEIYHENATNKIKQDLVERIKPRYMKVRGDWNVRGGITTIVESEYVKESWDGVPEEVEIKTTEHTSISR